MSDVANVDVDNFDASEGDTVHIEENKRLKGIASIQVYEINGPFFFGAADKFLTALGQLGTETEVLIVRMRNVPSMDATALHAFRRMTEICKRRHIRILVSGLKNQPLSVVQKAGLYDVVAKKHFFEKESDAVTYALEQIK